jgi:Tol biopolymer transport system component
MAVDFACRHAPVMLWPGFTRQRTEITVPEHGRRHYFVSIAAMLGGAGDFMADTIIVSEDLTIAAGHTFSFHGTQQYETGMLLQNNVTLLNYGSMIFDSSFNDATNFSGEVLGIGIDPDNPGLPGAHIVNHGLIKITATPTTRATGIMCGGNGLAEVTNAADGHLIVDGRYSTGILDYDSDTAITNAGEIKVNGADSSIGISGVNNGFNIVNTGSITATGKYGDLTWGIAVDSGGSITNSGTITASASTYYVDQTIGIALGALAPELITNSGTITAAYAIVELGNLDSGQSSKTTIENSGTLNGNVSLGANNDAAINTGTINGNVYLGITGAPLDFDNEKDFFDSRLGVVNGIVYGGHGDDTLLAGAGNNNIHGDTENDFLQGGTGDDTLYGGSGIDIASYEDATGSVTVDLNVKGFQSVGGGRGSDKLVGIEGISGSHFGDVLIAKGGNNVFRGHLGDDTFVFANHLTIDDSIDGGPGGDTLSLNGNYGTGFIFAVSTMWGVENINLAAGHNYSLRVNDLTVDTGAVFTVDGSTLGRTDHLTFDGRPDTDASFHLIGGDGDDVLTAGAQALRGIVIATQDVQGTSSAALYWPNSATTPNVLGVSPDGTKVLFRTDAALVGDDTNGTDDIYLRDAVLGTLTLISASEAGDGGNGASRAASLSPDGTKVVFSSAASNLVDGDTNGAIDVFVRELVTGIVTRVSTTVDGGQTVGDTQDHIDYILPGNPLEYFFTSNVGFTPDGGSVVFVSAASDLISHDRNDRADVFIKNLETGAVTRIGTNADAIDVDAPYFLGPMFNPYGAFSADGTKFVFTTDADYLVPDDTNHAYDVYVEDLTTRTFARASISAAGAQTTDILPSWQGVLSPDGSKVAFSSFAYNLVPGDTSYGFEDVLIKDLATGAITRIVAPDGTAPNGNSDMPLFSPDGTLLLFRSEASNLVAHDNNGVADFFVEDFVTGHIVRVSMDANGEELGVAALGAIFSGDGGHIAFETLDEPFARDVAPTSEIHIATLAIGTYGNDVLEGGDGDDILSGGAADDILTGGLGADRLTGGDGSDTFAYAKAKDSAGLQYDTVTGFDALAADRFDVAMAVTDVDPTILGALSSASFGHDLGAAVDHHHLHGHRAVLFTPDSGNLAGTTFLIIDLNGKAGYQATHDLVIRLDDAVNLGDLDPSDFI